MSKCERVLAGSTWQASASFAENAERIHLEYREDLGIHCKISPSFAWQD